jgi:protoporphyrinogen oxidase
MRVAIIGAGAGGLAAAYDLARAGYDVTVFESDATPGGLGGGFREPGWQSSVEKYYRHWFASDREILGFIRELGWEANILVRRPITAIFHDGKFFAYDSIRSWLAFPGLPFPLRVWNLLIAGFFLKVNPFWKWMEAVAADDWMRRWFGRRIYDEVWKPLLVGKFGEENYRLINMAWFWARMHSRTPNLVSYRGGMQAFFDQLAARLKGMGVSMRYGARVNAVAAHPEGGLELRWGSSKERFDACLATLSPHQLAGIAPALPEEYLAKLRSLRHMGAVIMVFALTHRLSDQGVYWHNLPKDAGFPFLALVEHTNFMSTEDFNGDHIVYCGDYLPLNHEYFHLSQEELRKRFLSALPRFNPAFQLSWVKKSWLFRTEYAQPIPLVCHSRNIPSVRTPLPGLYFASMSQVYPWDRGTNYAVRLGREAAAMIIRDQGRSTHPMKAGLEQSVSDR